MMKPTCDCIKPKHKTGTIVALGIVEVYNGLNWYGSPLRREVTKEHKIHRNAVRFCFKCGAPWVKTEDTP